MITQINVTMKLTPLFEAELAPSIEAELSPLVEAELSPLVETGLQRCLRFPMQAPFVDIALPEKIYQK